MTSARRRLASVIWVIVLGAASVGRADDFATRMLDATVKISHKDSTATGFFVTPPPGLDIAEKQVLLVTAAHVFEGMKGDKAALVFRIPQADGTFHRREVEIAVRNGDKPLWHKHGDEDTAVLAVKLPEDLGEGVVRPIDYESLATDADVRAAKLHVGSDLYVLGFPMRVEANPAGFPIARRAALASFPLTPIRKYTTFLASFATFAGDSGGPVFVAEPGKGEQDARPLVLGLVTRQMFSDENIKSIYEDRLERHPLELAIILPAEFIRDVVEKMKK